VTKKPEPSPLADAPASGPFAGPTVPGPNLPGADSPFGYNPAYGLTDDYRLRAVADAEILGRGPAAKKYRVHKMTIDKCRRALREQER
jgi:hypothetical protein